jgi:YVTN family beta-propeller protein
VTNQHDEEGTGSVSVIAGNDVVATILTFQSDLHGLAVSPDSKYVYVADYGTSFIDASVKVIDTATNAIATNIPVGNSTSPTGIAITPNGKSAYVTTTGAVLVIDTASNTVIKSIPVAGTPYLIAITPDSKYAYVTNTATKSVSVIETSTNTVFKTIPTPNSPNAVAIGPAETVTFSALNAKLAPELRKKPNHDAFQLCSEFILGSTSNGIDPVSEAVTLKVAAFTTAIPPGSFQKTQGKWYSRFVFRGVIDGVALNVVIEPTGADRYSLRATAHGANLAGTTSRRR